MRVTPLAQTGTGRNAPRARAFVSSLGQSMLSLSFDLGGMVSGAILAVCFDVFSAARWAIALFPGI